MMLILIIILLLILLIAVYPVIRDYLKKKKTVAISYTEGLAAIIDGQIDKAIELLKQSVTVDSNNIDAYLRLADLYTQKGDTDRVAKIYERLAVRHNLTPQEEKRVYQHLGKYYSSVNRLQKAITMFEELINLDKNNIANYEMLLSLYLKTERFNDAEELIKKMTKIQNDKKQIAQYYANLGKELLNRNMETSAKYFKQALALDNQNIDALTNLANYYYQKGEIKLAIEIYNEFLNYYPEKNHLVRKHLEQAYYDLNQYEQVSNFYEKLLKRVPSDSGLYLSLAEIYEKKEDYQKAIDILNKAPFELKKDIAIQIELAKLHLKNKDINKALNILETMSEHLK